MRAIAEAILGAAIFLAALSFPMLGAYALFMWVTG